MEQQALALPGPRISRVTLGRLHNLGNYEHVRYEVTVELPPGASPASVIRELTETLDGLEPRAPYSASEVRLAMAAVSKVEPTIADFDDGRDHYNSPAERLRDALREREQAARLLARYSEWQQKRDAALGRFDALGGTQCFTDAKEQWDDE